MIAVIIVLTLFVLLYFFLIFPSGRKHKDIKLLNGLYIAHRGFHGDYPENSIESFKQAIQNNYAIEIDIHLTKDGELVVFHDDDFKRMCGVDKGPEDLTLKEIKQLRLANTEFTVPTLKECLDAIDGKAILLIEFKMVKNNYKPLCEAANKILEKYIGKYFVQSFYPQVLNWYRINRKDVCRGQLSTTFADEKIFVQKLLGKLLFNFLSRPDFISYDVLYPNTFNRKVCTLLGAHPVGWTIVSKEQLEESKKHFKTYIFENFKP